MNRAYAQETEEERSSTASPDSEPNGNLNVPVIPDIARYLQQQDSLNQDQSSPEKRPDPPSILVQAGIKNYGKLEVLQNLNMTVREGTM